MPILPKDENSMILLVDGGKDCSISVPGQNSLDHATGRILWFCSLAFHFPDSILRGFCAGSLTPYTGISGLPDDPADPNVISAGNQGSAKRAGVIRVHPSLVSPCVRNGKMLFRTAERHKSRDRAPIPQYNSPGHGFCWPPMYLLYGAARDPSSAALYREISAGQRSATMD
jgi:hypothetical protein